MSLVHLRQVIIEQPQYIHLASNSTSATPLDIWIPSTPNVKPQIADQVAVGYFRNFRKDAFETSIEA